MKTELIDNHQLQTGGSSFFIDDYKKKAAHTGDPIITQKIKLPLKVVAEADAKRPAGIDAVKNLVLCVVRTIEVLYPVVEQVSHFKVN